MDDIVNPQDAELEEIVLGACLIESKAITLVAGILRPEVFYIEKNREIYAALQSMYRAGQVIDLMTVKEELTLPVHIYDPQEYRSTPTLV